MAKRKSGRKRARARKSPLIPRKSRPGTLGLTSPVSDMTVGDLLHVFRSHLTEQIKLTPIPESAKPELRKPERLKPEVFKPELLKPERLKPERLKPERSKPEWLKPELLKPELKPGPERTAAARKRKRGR
jgi:hypothetical protein